MNEAQKIAARAYGGGDFAHFIDMSDPVVFVAVKQCGDTLFKFLMAELAETEDCDTLDEAQRRVGKAIQELQEVRAALLTGGLAL